MYKAAASGHAGMGAGIEGTAREVSATGCDGSAAATTKFSAIDAPLYEAVTVTGVSMDWGLNVTGKFTPCPTGGTVTVPGTLNALGALLVIATSAPVTPAGPVS